MLYGRSFQIWNTKKEALFSQKLLQFHTSQHEASDPNTVPARKTKQQKLTSKRKETHKPFHWFVGIHTGKSTALFVLFN